MLDSIYSYYQCDRGTNLIIKFIVFLLLFINEVLTWHLAIKLLLVLWFCYSSCSLGLLNTLHFSIYLISPWMFLVQGTGYVLKVCHYYY